MYTADWTRLDVKRVHYRNVCDHLHNYTQDMLAGHL